MEESRSFRAALLLSSVLGAWAFAGVLGHRSASALLDPATWLSLDQVIVACAGLGLFALITWLAVAVLVSSWSWLRCAGRPTQQRRPVGVPRAVHRGVGLALGLSLSFAPIASHAATPSPAISISASATSSPAGGAQTLDLGWGSSSTTWTSPPPAKTSKPAAPTEPSVISQPRSETADFDDVVVLRGDTLWGIAAEHLGPDASNAEIAHEWPRWYDANRQVIGGDPDLIRPGQVLTPPQ